MKTDRRLHGAFVLALLLPGLSNAEAPSAATTVDMHADEGRAISELLRRFPQIDPRGLGCKHPNGPLRHKDLFRWSCRVGGVEATLEDDLQGIAHVVSFENIPWAAHTREACHEWFVSHMGTDADLVQMSPPGSSQDDFAEWAARVVKPEENPRPKSAAAGVEVSLLWMAYPPVEELLPGEKPHYPPGPSCSVMAWNCRAGAGKETHAGCPTFTPNGPRWEPTSP